MANSISTAGQLRAARALLHWPQSRVAECSGVSLPTVKRLEGLQGELAANVKTINALSRAFEQAGVEFIPENGGGPGVRLRKG